MCVCYVLSPRGADALCVWGAGARQAGGTVVSAIAGYVLFGESFPPKKVRPRLLVPVVDAYRLRGAFF